jgi:hypothetical protein
LAHPGKNVKTTLTYSMQRLALNRNEQIIGFVIEIVGGGFESLSPLPKGWRTLIDNKGPRHTVLEAELSFGSEVLTIQQMQAVVIKVVSAEVEGMPFRIGGYLVVTVDMASDRHVTLTPPHFLLHTD